MKNAAWSCCLYPGGLFQRVIGLYPRHKHMQDWLMSLIGDASVSTFRRCKLQWNRFLVMYDSNSSMSIFSQLGHSCAGDALCISLSLSDVINAVNGRSALPGSDQQLVPAYVRDVAPTFSPTQYNNYGHTVVPWRVNLTTDAHIDHTVITCCQNRFRRACGYSSAT